MSSLVRIAKDPEPRPPLDCGGGTADAASRCFQSLDGACLKGGMGGASGESLSFVSESCRWDRDFGFLLLLLRSSSSVDGTAVIAKSRWVCDRFCSPSRRRRRCCGCCDFGWWAQRRCSACHSSRMLWDMHCIPSRRRRWVVVGSSTNGRDLFVRELVGLKDFVVVDGRLLLETLMCRCEWIFFAAVDLCSGSEECTASSNSKMFLVGRGGGLFSYRFSSSHEEEHVDDVKLLVSFIVMIVTWTCRNFTIRKPLSNKP